MVGCGPKVDHGAVLIGYMEKVQGILQDTQFNSIISHIFSLDMVKVGSSLYFRGINLSAVE